jgi:hypothetical protein
MIVSNRRGSNVRTRRFAAYTDAFQVRERTALRYHLQDLVRQEVNNGLDIAILRHNSSVCLRKYSDHEDQTRAHQNAGFVVVEDKMLWMNCQ